MNSQPVISVIVPTYQRRASTERLLTALRNQTMPAGKYEVVVVIDGSLDGTREMIDQFQAPYHLLGVWQANQGRAAACNRGIREAAGSVVLILDDDMEPTPQILEAHWNAHLSQPNLGVIGAVPIQVGPSSPPVTRYIGMKFNQHLERLAHPGHAIKLRDFYSGNFSIERDVLLAIGMFDEHFKAYGNEDLELHWKLRQAGIKLVYCADAVAIQHYEKDYPALAKDNMAKGKTSIIFAKLHPDVLPEIKLSTYTQESLKWRVLRSNLLFFSRIFPPVPQMVVRFMTWLEKRDPANLALYYRLSLDYFYWWGVRSAQP